MAVQTPVPATSGEVEAEARAIRGVTGVSCPIRAALDRVIITASGAQDNAEGLECSMAECLRLAY